MILKKTTFFGRKSVLATQPDLNSYDPIQNLPHLGRNPLTRQHFYSSSYCRHVTVWFVLTESLFLTCSWCQICSITMVCAVYWKSVYFKDTSARYFPASSIRSMVITYYTQYWYMDSNEKYLNWVRKFVVIQKSRNRI